MTNLTTKRDELIRTASANMAIPIARVPCFADSLVQGGSSDLRTKFSAKTLRHRKPLKPLWVRILQLDNR
jgi:hypothetical protein